MFVLSRSVQARVELGHSLVDHVALTTQATENHHVTVLVEDISLIVDGGGVERVIGRWTVAVKGRGRPLNFSSCGRYGYGCRRYR
jgi:hypothetical protein